MLTNDAADTVQLSILQINMGLVIYSDLDGVRLPVANMAPSNRIVYAIQNPVTELTATTHVIDSLSRLCIGGG